LVVVIITVIFAIPSMFSSMMSGELFTSAFSWTNWGLFPFLIGLGLILYFPISETNWGATFGKSIMGLGVTTLNGSKPTFGQAFIRNLSKIYWVLLLLDVIMGLATQTDYRQKYTDKYIGTIVILK